MWTSAAAGYVIFHSGRILQPRGPPLRSPANPVHAGIAYRAGSAGSCSAVFHRDLLSVLNLPRLPALHAISSYLPHPPDGYVLFIYVARIVYDAGSSGDKLPLDRSISFLRSFPATIPQAVANCRLIRSTTANCTSQPRTDDFESQ